MVLILVSIQLSFSLPLRVDIVGKLRTRSRLYYSFTFSIADPSVLRMLVCLSIAGSKDTSAEMVYLQFQPSLLLHVVCYRGVQLLQ